jgi:hypothetical protein
MAPPADLDAFSPAELKALILDLLGKVADLERTVAAQREEIARLKGLKGRPPIKPSGMEQGTEPKPPRGRPGRRGRGKVVPRVAVEDRILKAAAPPGSRFRGYQDFLVQDLVLRTEAVRYRRERWLTPERRLIVAPLPGGVDGHFGPELRRFVLAQYHQGQATVPRLVAQLRAVGITISKRQVMRLLIAGQQRFLEESRDVLRAGHADYVVNAEALAYMRERALAGPVVALLAGHPERSFQDQAAWQAHLERLGIRGMEGSLAPARLATEGALWGAIKAHGLLPGTVIVSDDAGQFAVGEHALCWVHAERLVHKLDTFTDQQRAAQARMRDLIWWFYADLKAYRREPGRRRRSGLRARFDRLFVRRTGFVVLDRLLERLHANKPELLMVLDRPEVPLHTNGSENDIRAQVTRRKVSGGTRSDLGRDCRDAFLGLAKTCAKLGLSFWNYLGARLGIPGQAAIPYLPDLIRERCRPA